MNKKTSAEWALQPNYEDVLILDPDGWDRTNFDYSWNEECITEYEFIARLSKSTVLMNHETNTKISDRGKFL